jgi:hypothetical protein
MTWVTLSNGECPPFFPLEAGIFDLARPLNFRGEKGVSPKQKCRGVHAPIVALLRGKSVTHVMRSCLSRAGERVRAIANFSGLRKHEGRRCVEKIVSARRRNQHAGRVCSPEFATSYRNFDPICEMRSSCEKSCCSPLAIFLTFTCGHSSP